MAENNSFVYVALDHSSQSENISFADRLTEQVHSDRFGFKINLDSIADFSYDAMKPFYMVEELKKTGKPVFVDMKMWNGGRTMEQISHGCAELGVSIVNMYPHAGRKFIERVKRGLEGSETKLFTLTVLTHYTDKDTMALYGCPLDKAVERFAQIGIESGADGLIVPGNQIGDLRNAPVEILSPGIRPTWYRNQRDNDQEQIVTPREAIDNGANYLVVGSPIRKSENQAEALEKILEEIN